MMTTTLNKVKPCKFCSIEFTFKSKKAEFCSEAHKKAYSRARSNKMHKKRLHRFETSAFVYFLADTCKRSGTVEVVPKMLGELESLHKVYKYSLAANGYGEDDTYSLCHIFPAAHPTRVGTLHAENLVVSYRDLNAKHGNGFMPNTGRSISRLDLLPKWKVDPNQSRKSVVELLIDYLGKEYTATIAVKLKLQPSRRQSTIDCLIASTDERVPPQEVMQAMTTQRLTALKAEITGKCSYTSLFGSYNVDEVFTHELQRLSAQRPELQGAIDVCLLHRLALGEISNELATIKDRCGPYEYASAWKLFTPLAKAQFDLLHGGAVETFVDVQNTYLAKVPSRLKAA